MLKNLLTIEYVSEDGKQVILTCDPNVSTAIVKDSLCQFLKFACQVEDQEKAKLAEQVKQQEYPCQPQSPCNSTTEAAPSGIPS